MIIHAFDYIEEEMKKRLELTIVGDGPERPSLETQVNELGLNDIIHFTGWVDQENTFAYYKDADIFCFFVMQV